LQLSPWAPLSNGGPAETIHNEQCGCLKRNHKSLHMPPIKMESAPSLEHWPVLATHFWHVQKWSWRLGGWVTEGK
jgi:hypothetical protein